MYTLILTMWVALDQPPKEQEFKYPNFESCEVNRVKHNNEYDDLMKNHIIEGYETFCKKTG